MATDKENEDKLEEARRVAHYEELARQAKEEKEARDKK